MFDISSGELGVIAVVALIVLGPERLPKAARVAGAMLRKARLAYTEVRDQVERELNAEELKQQMAAARAGIDEVTKPLNEAVRDTDNALREAERAAKAELDDLSARAAAATGPEATSASAGAEAASDASAGSSETSVAGAASSDAADVDAAPPQMELPLIPTPPKPAADARSGASVAGAATTPESP